MCGRYAASRRPEDLVEEFALDEEHLPEPIAPRWNVAPTDEVYAVVQRAERRLHVMRWGLVPSWARDRSIGSRLINARVETVHEKPAFRRALAARRALVPADGYYEWYVGEDGRKRPYFICPRDGGVLSMAGLYEVWRDPTAAADDPAGLLWTVTVLTTTAEDALGRLHDRMPLLVEPDRYAAWLDPAVPAEPDRLRALLVPAAPGRLHAYPVSTEVGNVRNDGPHLVAPLPVTRTPATPPTATPEAGDAEQAALF